MAVAQVGAAVGDVDGNLGLARRYVRRAAARGADLIVFPECFVQGYSLRSDLLRGAQAADGPAITALASLAAAANVAVVAGFVERNPGDADHPFNSVAVIGRDGRSVGIYRKTHLYEREHEAFTVGDAYPVFDLAIDGDRRPIRLGVCICRDIEFPEVARLLALGGAQVMVVPSADMEPYRAQQAANLASRAIENNVYVALANTVGRRPGVTFFGGSGVAGPDGSLVTAGYLRPRLIVATLSDDAIESSGGRGSYLAARRPETYAGLLDGSGGGAVRTTG